MNLEQLTPSQHLIYAAFGAGAAYLLYKHHHPYLAYVLAAGAAWNLASAASSPAPKATP